MSLDFERTYDLRMRNDLRVAFSRLANRRLKVSVNKGEEAFYLPIIRHLRFFVDGGTVCYLSLKMMLTLYF